VWGKGKNGIEMANLIPDVRVVLWFDITEREIDVQCLITVKNSRGTLRYRELSAAAAKP
jgi:hypothetical protein